MTPAMRARCEAAFRELREARHLMGAVEMLLERPETLASVEDAALAALLGVAVPRIVDAACGAEEALVAVEQEGAK